MQDNINLRTICCACGTNIWISKNSPEYREDPRCIYHSLCESCSNKGLDPFNLPVVKHEIVK